MPSQVPTFSLNWGRPAFPPVLQDGVGDGLELWHQTDLTLNLAICVILEEFVAQLVKILPAMQEIWA